MSEKGISSVSTNDLWRPLQLYCLYRFCLGISLLIMSHHNVIKPIFAGGQPNIFVKTSIVYAVFAFITLLFSFSFKVQYKIQANIPIYFEIILLTVIMHACGGVLSGMGLLLVILAAGHSILHAGKYALLTAAICTIALLIEHFVLITTSTFDLNLYNMVGLLGILIFLASLVTNFLSLRIYGNQKIIQQQRDQLARSTQINSHIVTLMQQGVVVLGQDNIIQTMNHSAKKLLGLSVETNYSELIELPEGFVHCIYAWIQNKQNLSPIKILENLPQIRVSLQKLGDKENSAILIFLYDIAEENKKAQDLKLTSLGHLTANIAHELRNPLGVASHAAQLLIESKDLSDENLKLGQMILQNCDRMNQVIKNVLSLSGQKANIQTLSLNQWLQNNISKFKFPDFPEAKIELDLCLEQELYIQIDSTQLTQIIINLCENGLRHNAKKHGVAKVKLKTGHLSKSNNIYLDIIDQGEGIPENIREFIFEPFYTTEKKGTGLGLYLTRELCQINGANIQYAKQDAQSQFRLTFQGDHVK